LNEGHQGSVGAGTLLDLDAIAEALEGLARTAPAGSSAGREPFSPEVLPWMIDGYALLDEILKSKEDPFSIGGVRLLLELNHRVLCGKQPDRRQRYAEHVHATEERFLTDHAQGAGGFCEWAAIARGHSPRRFAAAVFVRMVSAPQLFLEGNQRTATLAASHVLVRAGLPPLVVTAETHASFAAIAASARATDRDHWSAPVLIWLVRRRMKRFLDTALNPRFLRR
jgi:hypothetical protein